MKTWGMLEEGNHVSCDFLVDFLVIPYTSQNLSGSAGRCQQAPPASPSFFLLEICLLLHLCVLPCSSLRAVSIRKSA